MKSTTEYKNIARKGFKLNLTDSELDALYTKSQNAIDEFKVKHPMMWASAEEIREQHDGIQKD